jgi:branched-chain amino acid transport system ATP-binding protein
VQVLFGVDIEVAENEIVALLGTNGAGKSTLLRAVSGLRPIKGGRVALDGHDIGGRKPESIAAAGVAYMPGGRGVFPTLSVAENLEVGGWFLRRDPTTKDAALDEALELFPRLRDRYRVRAADMSGGEQQMLSLAMSFLRQPRLLMIDELSLGLSPAIIEQLVEVVRAIHRQGATILIVEQSVNLALTIADRAYFMEKGQVVFSGPTRELLTRDDVLRSVLLGGAAATGLTARARDPEAITSGPPDVDARTDARPVLAVDGLHKRFGGLVATNGVSLSVARGEILGLIGPNGAGKTTLFDLMSGFVPLDRGTIELGGIDVTNRRPDQRAKLGLGRCFQDSLLFPSLTVAENLAVALERNIHDCDALAALLGLPSVREAEEDVAWTVSDLIDLLELGHVRNRFAADLSTGTRRVVDLAMAVAHRPDVLLLDEPSSGLAQRESEAMVGLLRRVQVEIGCSLLVIEHDMNLITTISHRMLALELGAVIAEGTPHDVLAHPRVVESYLGTNQAAINRSGAPLAAAGRRRKPLRAHREHALPNGSSRQTISRNGAAHADQH